MEPLNSLLNTTLVWNIVGPRVQGLFSPEDSTERNFTRLTDLEILTYVLSFITLPVCSLLFFVRACAVRRLIDGILLALTVVYVVLPPRHGLPGPFTIGWSSVILAHSLVVHVLLLLTCYNQGVFSSLPEPSAVTTFWQIVMLVVSERVLEPLQDTPNQYWTARFWCVALELVLLRDIVNEAVVHWTNSLQRWVFRLLYYGGQESGIVSSRDRIEKLRHVLTVTAVVLSCVIYVAYESETMRHLLTKVMSLIASDVSDDVGNATGL